MTILTLTRDSDTHGVASATCACAPSRSARAHAHAHVATVIAPKGSALEARLRSSGWVARSGWLSHAVSGRSEWLVRYERPEAQTSEPGA